MNALRNTYAKAGAGVTVALLTLGTLAGIASATPADPAEAGFASMGDKVTTIAPLFFGLVVVLIGISLAYRWMRKGSSAS